MLISALEHGDRIAFLERDHGLFPARGGAAGAAPRDGVATHLHGAHAGGRDAEQLLEGVPDLVLVRLGVHLESVHLAVLVGGRALLGHHRAHDDLVQRGHYLFPFCFFGAAFLADLAVLFLAALALPFLAALGVLFLAALGGFAGLAAFGAAAFVLFLAALGALAWAGARFSRSASAGSSSAASSRVSPVRAPSSTTTASAHRTSYADAWANGITSTDGRFRPLR